MKQIHEQTNRMENLQLAWEQTKHYTAVSAKTGVKVFKFAIVATLLVTSITGAYVLSNQNLRNTVIDTIQGESPKG